MKVCMHVINEFFTLLLFPYMQDRKIVAEYSLDTVMSTILRMPGPLVSLDSFRHIASKKIRTLPKDLFATAIINLQELGFGDITNVSGIKNKINSVFVKKSSSEAREALLATNLCTYEQYVMKIRRPIPACLKFLQYLAPAWYETETLQEHIRDLFPPHLEML